MCLGLVLRCALPLLVVFVAFRISAAELHSYALVQDDGSLRIQGRTVYLDGIYLPPTERQCEVRIRPVRCAQRAALALEFRIQGFVYCVPKSTNADGSLNASCFVDRTSFDPGEDLAAYLIRKGWALALPDAPFEYQALEKIARHRGVGVWGFSVDSVERR